MIAHISSPDSKRSPFVVEKNSFSSKNRLKSSRRSRAEQKVSPSSALSLLFSITKKEVANVWKAQRHQKPWQKAAACCWAGGGTAQSCAAPWEPLPGALWAADSPGHHECALPSSVPCNRLLPGFKSQGNITVTRTNAGEKTNHALSWLSAIKRLAASVMKRWLGCWA